MEDKIINNLIPASINELPQKGKKQQLDPSQPVTTGAHGVINGICQQMEQCSKCNKPFPNYGGSDGPMLHANTNLPICSECIGLDCVYCGKHKPGMMQRIPGTLYSKCSGCSGPGPSKDQNKHNGAPVGAQERIGSRGW